MLHWFLCLENIRLKIQLFHQSIVFSVKQHFLYLYIFMLNCLSLLWYIVFFFQFLSLIFIFIDIFQSTSRKYLFCNSISQTTTSRRSKSIYMPCKESPIFPFHISVECDVGVDIRRQTQILIGHVISDRERFSLPFWLFSSSLVMAFNSNAFNVNIRYVNPQNSFYIRRRIGFSGYGYIYTKYW